MMEGKTPSAQVAQCQDHLGHNYRSGMQQTNAGNTENAPTALIVSNVPHSKVSPCAHAATVLTYVTAKSSYIVPTWASCT